MVGYRRRRNSCRVLVENLKGRDHLKDLGIDGVIIYKEFLKN
jgi:uncharacterized protein YjiS (DUF1127 family)